MENLSAENSTSLKNAKRKIRQSRNLPRYRFTIGLNELKLLQFIFGKIRRSDTQFFAGDATVDDICEYCGFKGDDNYKYEIVKNTAFGLAQCVFEYQHESNRDKNGKYKFIPWLSSIQYDKGIVSYEINPVIKEELLQLHQSRRLYIDIDPELLPMFKTQYGLRIYMILLGEKAVSQTDLFYSTTDFADMLLLSGGYNPKESSDASSNQKKAILVPAVKEINNITDISVKCMAVKKKNVIVGWRFEIIDKRNLTGETGRFSGKTKKEIQKELIEHAANWNEIIDIIYKYYDDTIFDVSNDIKNAMKTRPDLYNKFFNNYYESYGTLFNLETQLRTLWEKCAKYREMKRQGNTEYVNLLSRTLENFKLKKVRARYTKT